MPRLAVEAKGASRAAKVVVSTAAAAMSPAVNTAAAASAGAAARANRNRPMGDAESVPACAAPFDACVCEFVAVNPMLRLANVPTSHLERQIARM